jgi:hypothetical protein
LSFLLSCGLCAADSLTLVPLDINDKLLTLLAGKDDPVPAGHLRFIGSFNEQSFSIPSLSNITVKNSSCSQIPLKIEESSLIGEFGSTVSLWLSFDVPSDEFSQDKPLTIEWGKDVSALNGKVKSIKVDIARASSYRTFTWRKKNDNSSFATIEVIADSSADYYFLWYLLPIAVIFAVLAIRKALYQKKGESANSKI